MTKAQRPATILFVLAHAVVIQLIVFAMRPTLSYAVLDAGGAAALLGIVIAAFAVPALLLALPAGHVIDQVGERLALLVGAGALILAALVAMLARSSVVLLLIATMLLGVGHLLSVIGEQAIVANTTKRGHYDSRFGHFTFASAIGQTAGPLLLALPGGTVETPPIGLIFLLCGGFSVLLLVISLFIRNSPRVDMASRPRMLSSAMSLLRTQGLPRALLAGAVVLASVDLFLTYLPALGHERKIAAALISLMLVIRSMLSMFSRLFLGPLVHAFGRRRLMVWSIAISAVALIGLAPPVPIWVLIVFTAIYGFMIGTCQPITMSWISELATPGTRGLAMSLRLASNRLGQTVLPSLLGTVAAASGAAGVFVATGIVLFGGAWSGAAVGEVELAPAPEEPVPDAS
ncbi:MAG: MFS transporter [Lacisediminihabitans sp.]